MISKNYLTFTHVLGRGAGRNPAGPGDRWEARLDQWIQRATDWQIWVPAMVAPLASRWTHGILKGWQAAHRAAAGAQWFNAGLAGQTLAAGGAFVAETLSFSQGTRVLQHLSQVPVLWRPRDLLMSTYTSALTLLALRGCGLVGSQVYLRFHGIHHLYPTLQGWQRKSHAWFQQASSYLGLVLTHHLESKMGLLPNRSDINLWLEALQIQGALHLGGFMIRRLFPMDSAAFSGNLTFTSSFQQRHILTEAWALAGGRGLSKNFSGTFENNASVWKMKGREGEAAAQDVLSKLPPRQRQMAYYLSEGWSVEDIAFKLGITKNTIRNHLKILYLKFGVHHRNQLVSILGHSQAKVRPDFHALALQFNLTPRQREVVEILVQGHTVKEAAGRLGITSNTLRNHLKSIFQKMDIDNQGELLAIVLKKDSSHLTKPDLPKNPPEKEP